MVTFFYVTTKQLELKAILKNCLIQKMDIICFFQPYLNANHVYQ